MQAKTEKVVDDLNCRKLGRFFVIMAFFILNWQTVLLGMDFLGMEVIHQTYPKWRNSMLMGPVIHPLPVPVDVIDTVWFFSSASAGTISDSLRPPYVLGDTGPWTYSLVDTDPNGNPMPFPGIKYTLEAGGTPMYDINDAVFVFPTVSVAPNTPTGIFFMIYS